MSDFDVRELRAERDKYKQQAEQLQSDLIHCGFHLEQCKADLRDAKCTPSDIETTQDQRASCGVDGSADASKPQGSQVANPAEAHLPAAAPKGDTPECDALDSLLAGFEQYRLLARRLERELAALRQDIERYVADNTRLLNENEALESALAAEKLAREAAERKLNSPELHDFAQAVVLEAAHQRARWGNAHDEGKSAEDWMWLVGYLATKATQANRYGDREKYLHHIITCAAACNNWHASASGANNEIRAGAHVSIAELGDAARSKP